MELPKYRKPPVTEVLCCVYFKELTALHAPHLGSLWNRWKSGYPRLQTASVLPPTSQPVKLNIDFMLHYNMAFQQEQGQLARTIFINKDETSLVQLQRDRLVLNWRQSHDESPYPSYSNVLLQFKNILSDFRDFIKSENMDHPIIIGSELCYINHILYGREIQDATSVNKVLPNFLGCIGGNSFLKTVSSINANTTFELPENNGLLNFIVQTAQRRSDGQLFLRVDLIARKFDEYKEDIDLWDWFDIAHEAIVTSFTTMTDGEVQSKIWERYR